MIIKTNDTNKAFSFFVIMLPFLAQYKGILPVISLGETLLIPFLLLYLLESKFTVTFIPSDLVLSVLYLVSILSFISAAASHFSLADYLTVFTRIVFYGALIWVGRRHFSFQYIKDIYIYLALFMSLYAVVQYFYTMNTGNYLPIYLNYNWLFGPEQRARNLELFYRALFRPSALFLEPGYLVYFLFPALAHVLTNDLKRMHMVIISLGIIISNSMAGIILLALCWGMYLWHEFSANLKSGGVKVALIIILTGAVLLTAFKMGFLEPFVSRWNSGGSFGARITRGLLIFKDMPVFLKMTGVGLNNMGAYVDYHGISTIYDNDAAAGYAATYISVMIQTGLAGLNALIAYIARLRSVLDNRFKKMLYWIFVLIMAYESILFTYRFAFIVFLLYDRFSGEPVKKPDENR